LVTSGKYIKTNSEHVNRQNIHALVIMLHGYSYQRRRRKNNKQKYFIE